MSAFPAAGAIFLEVIHLRLLVAKRAPRRDILRAISVISTAARPARRRRLFEAKVLAAHAISCCCSQQQLTSPPDVPLPFPLPAHGHD